MNTIGPIGVFDSGYGGLTILQEFLKELPEYDYIYLGDNARAPYGNRSFEVVHDFTLEAVRFLQKKGCRLIILACNTSSAKALRTLQQIDLLNEDPDFRILGVIRPSTETIGAMSQSNCIGILGTQGTIQSESYKIELEKFSPKIKVIQQACPMWVPLIESNKHNTDIGVKVIKNDIQELLEQNKDIDTILLACTHYPLVIEHVRKAVGKNIQVVSQGPIVANKLMDYLFRNEFMRKQISKGNTCRFMTTENAAVFDASATQFLEKAIRSTQVSL